MSKGKRLGRGLGALLADEPPKREASGEVEIRRIRPNPAQPRKTFDEAALADLARSIREHGIVQPIIVRAEGDDCVLIAGERRLRAAEMAGRETVPVIYRDYDDRTAAEVALIENLQREDLNPMEESAAYRRLMQTYGCTQEDVAEAVGKSRPYVANILRLQTLPEEIQVKLSDGVLTVGQVRPLLVITSEEEQKELARRIEQYNLSSRQAEELVRDRKARKEKAKKPKADDPAASYFRKIENELKLSLGTGVHIKNGKGKNRLRGAITIEYAGEEEFQRLIAFLKNEE